MTSKASSHETTWDRQDAAKLMIRAIVGFVLVFHGAQKLFGVWGGPGIEGFAAYNAQLGIPLPELSAYLAALAELGGGLAIATGLLSRIAAVPVVITMLTAAFVAHDGFSAQSGGGEYALTLAVVVSALALAGPGRLTLGRLLGVSPHSILQRA